MNLNNEKLIVRVFFGIIIAVNLISLIRIFQIPSDPKNAFLLGYSLARWLLVGIESISLFLFVLLLMRLPKTNISKNLFVFGEKFIIRHLWVSGTILFIAIGFVFSTPERFGRYAAYVERLNPVIDFFGFALFLYLFFVFIHWALSGNDLKFNKKWFLSALIVYALFLVSWILILMTRVGLEIEFYNWGGGATPVLFSTVAIAAYLTFSFSVIEKKLKNKKMLYWLIPVVLYIATCTLWITEPFAPSYFAPRPVAPNFETYPHSDSHYYAITAQSLLAGEGYMNRGVVQRPIYGFLLYLFNLAAGKDYFSWINLQVLLYAVFPLLLYLLGKKIGGTNFGLFVGLIAMIREVTAYRTTPYIEVSHSKLLMTDFFAAIFAAWICYLTISIIQSRQKREIRLVLLGIVVGLGLLVRFNILFLIFPVLFALIFFTHQRFSKKLIQIAIFSFSIFMILFPWMLRNYVYLGEFGVENAKIRAIINTRFEETYTPPVVDTPSPTKPDSMILPQRQANGLDIVGIIHFTTANFLHNEIHSILILPNTLEWVKVDQLIEENEYFLETWEGKAPLRLIVFVFINLWILSFGISIAIKKIGLAGIVPLLIQVAYNLSNGLGRVSGWRYVLVTDWVIYLYYALALFFGVQWLAGRLKVNQMRTPILDTKTDADSQKPTLIGIGLLILFTIGINLPEALIKPKYAGVIPCEKAIDLASDPNFTKVLAELDACNNADKIILYEKALFPRYYQAEKGEPGTGLPWFSPMETAHLGFSIVGPIISGVVYETDQSPPQFTNGQPVIVIGSWNRSIKDYPYIDADSIFLLEDRYLYEKNSSENHK